MMALQAAQARGVVEECRAALRIAGEREDFFGASGGLGEIRASGRGEEALEKFDDERIG